jgi:hypothetical protein
MIKYRRRHYCAMGYNQGSASSATAASFSRHCNKESVFDFTTSRLSSIDTSQFHIPVNASLL